MKVKISIIEPGYSDSRSFTLESSQENWGIVRQCIDEFLGQVSFDRDITTFTVVVEKLA